MGKHQRAGAPLRCLMSSARPLFVHGSGSKGMSKGWGLLFSKIRKSLWKMGAEAKVSLDIQDLWVVPKQATPDTDMEDVYGVGLEDEDKNSEDEDLDQAGEGVPWYNLVKTNFFY